MIVRAAEVRESLRDADLVLLLEPETFEAWKRMTEGLAEAWHGDLAERLAFATDDIAGRAARRWPEALDETLAREGLRAEGYATIRAAASDDWRTRLEAFGTEPELATMEPRHVLDGVLPSIVLAIAITEALGGTPRQEPDAMLREGLVSQDDERRNDAMMLGAAYFGTRKVARETSRAPRPKGLSELATAIGLLRWSDRTRAKALGPDGKRLAERAGQAALGHHAVPRNIETETYPEGAHILIDGRKLLHLPTETLETLAALVPRAAAARLRELSVEDDGLDTLADAIETDSSRRSFASVLTLPSNVTPTGELRHQARLYEAMPAGPRPHTIAISSAHGREAHAVALADGKGAHVGYAAHVPLSREFLGRPLRAVYGLDGARRGRLQAVEDGWQYLEGEPTGGYLSMPERLEVA